MIAEYKQIDTAVVENVITVIDYDDDGNEIGTHEETVQKTVPVMGVVYREMTADETAQARATELASERERILTAQEEYESNLVSDAYGNRYEQTIVDGHITLNLVESADGTLNI